MMLMQNTAARPRIGIAPDSWGVWNAVDTAQPSPEQYLREVRESGYQWTELGPYGYLDTDADRLNDQLTEHDLHPSGGTVFTALHRSHSAVDDAWIAVSEVASLVRALGAEHLIVIPELWRRDEGGHVVGDRTFSSEEWRVFLQNHNSLGTRLWEEFGLRQQFHSHADCAIGTDAEITRLLEGTDPQSLILCLDTGHFAYYYGDCVSLIERFPERIGYLHLKQVNPEILPDILKNDVDFATAVQRGAMVEPPHGTPDFGPVLAAAATANPGLFAIVEQDMYPVDSFATSAPIARRTREHIATCGTLVRFR